MTGQFRDWARAYGMRNAVWSFRYGVERRVYEYVES